jgi:hypothetical protein
VAVAAGRVEIRRAGSDDRPGPAGPAETHGRPSAASFIIPTL